MPIDVSATLAELVTADPRRSRILDRLTLDYCCNGHRTLAEAVAEAGLGLQEVASSLDLPARNDGAREELPREQAALAHDIVDVHHAYMWEEMPALEALVEKVHRVHVALHPELADVRATYLEALAALDPHMTTEERVVFPAISRMERTSSPNANGSLQDPIRQLRDEHEVVGRLFRRIRELTRGYEVPDGACGSYQMMLQRLEAMELDLHEHIHKENNVLFPRALELEERVTNA